LQRIRPLSVTVEIALMLERLFLIRKLPAVRHIHTNLGASESKMPHSFHA